MKILIIDAFNYIFRAFFASPKMTTKAGFPTNGLHLFTTMILSAIHKIEPDGIILAFEPEGGRKSLFRSQLYPEYKAQRNPPPDELVQQLPYFRPLVDALGIKTYSVDGFEADDIIATLTDQAVAQGHHVIIGSSDKDLMQLIREDGSVSMLVDLGGSKSAKGPKWATYQDVIERFSVPPQKVADVLALSGDTIDNIPGCKGIGEKTAGQLIAQFGSLEELMARLDEIKKPAQHKNLVEFSANATLSKKLVSLVFDVPVTLEIKGFEPNAEALDEFLTRFEMVKLKRELLGENKTIEQKAAEIAEQAMATDPLGDILPTHLREPVHQPVFETNNTARQPELVRPLHAVNILTTLEQVKAFFKEAETADRLGIWPLWRSTKPNALTGVALATAKEAVYVPFNTNAQRSLFAMADQPNNIESPTLKFLFNSKTTKCVFGVKPFVKLAKQLDLSFDISTWFDVEIAAYVLHPENAPYVLSDVTQHYLGTTPNLLPETWLGSGKKRIEPENQPMQTAASACAQWADLVEQLATILPGELTSQNLMAPYESLDMPLAPVLAQMEYNGVLLDLDALKALSDDYQTRMTELEKQAYAYAGEAFNINSPKQVGELLYGKLKLEPTRKKKTSSGAFSTDEETLESLSEQHPLPRIILNYRELTKLKSTYADALAEQADSQTHRIHCKFNACVTATTRLSSSDPNLQNIPSRGEEGRKIKQAFVARPGWSFVGADYSQIELRLMAAFSKDKMLCDAFLNGIDVHTKTASAIFDIDTTQVTKEQRQIGKTINFALLYGMGVQKLARETGHSTKEAKVFIDKFKAQFHELHTWFDAQLKLAQQTGETRTVFGHRRVITEFASPNGAVRALADRIAGNTPVQGGASDIVKKAMLRLDKAIQEAHLQAKLLIQVHDELLVECPDEEVEIVSQLLRTSMENAASLCVPLAVELRTGKRWTDMK